MEKSDEKHGYNTVLHDTLQDASQSKSQKTGKTNEENAAKMEGKNAPAIVVAKPAVIKSQLGATLCATTAGLGKAVFGALSAAVDAAYNADPKSLTNRRAVQYISGYLNDSEMLTKKIDEKSERKKWIPARLEDLYNATFIWANFSHYIAKRVNQDNAAAIEAREKAKAEKERTAAIEALKKYAGMSEAAAAAAYDAKHTDAAN